jgi:ADP-ribosylglycohydrolase
MTADTLHDRARGCLAGLAIGDALGQPTEGKTPAQIRDRWGTITDYVSDDPVGSDDTEYAVFSAQTLLRHGRGLTFDDVADAWRTHVASQRGGFKGAGFSEMLAIRNLREGQGPPACGEHLHSWSDGLAMRVAPFGIVAPGDPDEAARLAEVDGVVSHAGEGLLGGRAVAAAVAVSMTGATTAQATAAALAVVPADSWTARAVREAVEIGEGAGSVGDALDPLYDALVCHPYPWADLGPEAVGLAFGLLAASDGAFEDAVLGGANIGRDTDTIAAIAGAVVGARIGLTGLPPRWVERVQTVQGLCIRTVAGTDLLALADDLAAFTLSGA